MQQVHMVSRQQEVLAVVSLRLVRGGQAEEEQNYAARGSILCSSEQFLGGEGGHWGAG